MAFPHGPILILSPHADDEALGCFAFLRPGCHVLYLGIEDRPYVSRQGRLEEVQAGARKHGFTFEALNHPVNAYQVTTLIPALEAAIQAARPETVLIPQPSYNQDHRAVHDAALVALRPHDRNWFVPNVLVFEQPDSILWRHGGESEPNYFRAIDIEGKLHTYSLYATQVRGHRSPGLVQSLARIRGVQAGVPYAEGFLVKRMVEGRETA